MTNEDWVLKRFLQLENQRAWRALQNSMAEEAWILWKALAHRVQQDVDSYNYLFQNTGLLVTALAKPEQG